MIKIFASMHNSAYDVMYWGGHAQITLANTNAWWTVEADEWADFIDQMEVSQIGGTLSQLDDLRDNSAADYPHLAGAIVAGDVTAGAYTGGTNPITFYLAMARSQAHSDLQTIWEENPENVVYQVSLAIWDAYEEYLINTYNTIPEAFLYFIQGQSGAMSAAPGVLKYKGSWVVAEYGWKRFDRITGIHNHRINAVARGVYGGAYDISDVPGQTGAGVAMRIDQRMGGGVGFMGKIYMLSDFKLGTEVLDTNLVSMVSIVVTP
jgi:hypothetical protein